MEHRIPAVREHLHGTYFARNSPVFTVESGDIVDFETLEVGWRVQPLSADRPPVVMPKREAVDDGPALTGPVFIEGAEPGDTLEIAFLSFVPGDWGWTSAGGEANRVSGIAGVHEQKVSVFWDIDREKGLCRNQWGHEVPLRPFLGCVGVASDCHVRVPGWVPHPKAGGNLDAPILGAGSSLFLPVLVKGALFSVGDGHAAQGFGEIGGTAIECPMQSARMQLILHKGCTLSVPRALSEGRWHVLGTGESLESATEVAINGMLDLLTEKSGLSRPEALALASSVVDLKILQIVNPLKGVVASLRVAPECLRRL